MKHINTCSIKIVNKYLFSRNRSEIYVTLKLLQHHHIIQLPIAS
ncbi:hypothetical protein AZ037_000234 [Klebsiella michiganensis]|nr:hypothetical protein AZ037_000234 [Klebsiella michiganensis]